MKSEPKRRLYELPIPIIHAGKRIPAGESVDLLPDQIERIEAAVRAQGNDDESGEG